MNERKTKPSVQIIHADCERWIVDQPDDCVDVVILDPPYKWQYADNIILESMRVCRGPVFLMHPIAWDYESEPRQVIPVDEGIGRRSNVLATVNSEMGYGQAIFSVFNAPDGYEPLCGGVWTKAPPFVHFPNDNEHPGMKPWSLFNLLLFTIDVQHRVGIVLDPFMGSGNCGLAAQNFGMDYIGVEIEKKWCDRARAMLCQK